MFYYETPPQDFFEGMVRMDEIVKQDVPIVRLFHTAMSAAKVFGKRWEGDIRGKELYVFALPDPERASTVYGLVWKQENGGTTFIASPAHLHWLADFLIWGD
jgi:hypothetical protein